MNQEKTQKELIQQYWSSVYLKRLKSKVGLDTDKWGRMMAPSDSIFFFGEENNGFIERYTDSVPKK